MKRWRVVQFPSAEAAESYLNGLSIEPDQIRGMFAAAPAPVGAGVTLVCWLTAHQQRIEQLHRAPRADDDLALPADQPGLAVLPLEDSGIPDEPRASQRRQREDDPA